MGNDQHEGMALLIFGVSTLPQSIGLIQEFTSATVKFAAWNIQELQPLSEARVQEPAIARKFLAAGVLAPKTYQRGR